MSKLERPLVGVIMGSDSDLPVMKAASDVLQEFAVAHEVTIVSAHRTADWMVEYAKAAEGRGLRVIIAGAGGAAHLPGMVAALTVLPVIGVPVKGKNLEGMDSLLSIVQMPPGVPVATVAVNGAKNAGLLAVKVLGTGDERLRLRLGAYAARMKGEVMKKSERLRGIGAEEYLKEREL